MDPRDDELDEASLRLLELAESASRSSKRESRKRGRREDDVPSGRLLRMLMDYVTAESLSWNRFKTAGDVAPDTSLWTPGTPNVLNVVERSLFDRGSTNPTSSVPSNGDSMSKYLLSECSMKLEFTNQCKFSVYVTCYKMLVKRTTTDVTKRSPFAVLGNLFSDGGISGLSVDYAAQMEDAPLIRHYYQILSKDVCEVPPGDSKMFVLRNEYGKCTPGSYVRPADYLPVGHFGQPDREIYMVLMYRGQLITGTTSGSVVAQAFNGWFVRVRRITEYRYKVLRGGSTSNAYNVNYDTEFFSTYRSIGSDLTRVNADT